MSATPPTVPTAAYAPPVAEPAPALRYEPSSSAEPWRPEATAIVVGAAAASVLELGIWGGVLWRYLQPAAFQGRVTFWPSVPVGLTVFALGGLFHATVVAGAAAMLARSAAARLLLLFGAAGVLGLGVFYLVASSWPRPAVSSSDLFLRASNSGVQLLSTSIPHALLLFAVTRPAARRMSSRAEGSPIAPSAWPIEAKAIVLAVALDAFCHLVQTGVSVWFANSARGLRPAPFAETFPYWFNLLAYAAVYATLLAGGAAALLKRHGRTAPWLIAGAAGWLALQLYGLAASWWIRPSGYPRDHGAELIVNVTLGLFRLGATAVAYALVLYVATRLYAKRKAGRTESVTIRENFHVPRDLSV